jgi:hypothetical protein
MGAFMVGQAVAAVLAWLWAVMGLRSHPPTPPSASSAQRREGDTAEGPGSWKETLQEVRRQKEREGEEEKGGEEERGREAKGKAGRQGAGGRRGPVVYTRHGPAFV